MSSSAESQLPPAYAAAQAAAAAAARPAAGSGKTENMRFGMHTATVLIYLAIAAVVLAPGLWLWLLPDTALGNAWADRQLLALRQALQDIHFGSGLRFWLGVTGLSMMVLLLLYPLRKAMAKSRWLGSIGGWFHLHMIFGVAGPVLILYHCNFGRGAPDANVALWSMLAVAGSGIVGHFIYANVSANFYANKQAARAQLDAINAALAQLDAMHPSRLKLKEDLEAFDAELLTPRRGIYANLVARFKMERRRGALARAIGWHITRCAEQLNVSEAEQIRLRSIVGTHFWSYMRMARHAATRSIREQIWARWRLFHLPAFLIMVIAAGLHVAAVWNLDDKYAQAAQPPLQTIAPASAAKDPVKAAIKVKPVARQAPPVVADAGARAPTAAATPTPAEAKPILKSRPVAVARPAVPPTALAPARPEPVAQPKPATPQPAPPQAVVIADTSAAKVERAPAPLPLPAPERPPAPKAQSSPPAAATAMVDNDEIAELKRRFDGNPMSLGGVKPRTLLEQIAELKQKQKNKQFAHAEAETGFALTGQHVKVDCASCHSAPFPEPIKPSSTPRACVNCHKKDDVHRGRRQNCASCHTTKNWSEVIRK